MTDTRPIAAYLATLVVNGFPHRIRTTGRDEQAVRDLLHEDKLRRTRQFYDLHEPHPELAVGVGWEVVYLDPEPKLVVEWGNVGTWNVTDLARGGTWAR